MKSIADRLSHLAVPFLGLVIALGLSGCDTLPGDAATSPAEDGRPIVSFIEPTDGAEVAVGQRVPIRATTRARNGVMRIELLVNDKVVDGQSLTIAQPRYDFDFGYRFPDPGEYRVTVVAFDVNGVASDLTTLAIKAGVPAPGEPTVATPAETPVVIYVTATPLPSATRTHTPFVIYVTATAPSLPKPAPSETRRPPAGTAGPSASSTKSPL